MNYAATTELIDAITPYIKADQITIRTCNEDWKTQTGISDLVTVDAANHVGFEVFDKGIIVFYFTDHEHFDDPVPQSEDYDYVKAAKAFLIQLFQFRIRHEEIYKGKTLCTEKYYMVDPYAQKEEYIGGTWFGLVRLINPFAKKSSRSTLWQYDRDQGQFITRQPDSPPCDDVEVFYINEDCYIDLFYRHHTYSYLVMKRYLDEYNGTHYWHPADDIPHSGFYDTKEKALQSAMEAYKKASDQ